MPAPSFQEYLADARQFSDNDSFSDNDLLQVWSEDFGQQFNAEQTGDLNAGWIQGKANVGSFIDYGQAALSDVFGMDELRDRNIAEAQAAEQEAALYSQGRPTRVEDIDSLGSAVDFIQYQAGAAVPTLLESLLGGVAGAAASGGANPVGFIAGAASKGAAKQIVKNLVAQGVRKDAAEKLAKDSVEKYIADKAKGKVANEAIGKAISGEARSIGATLGAGTVGYQMGVGDLYGTSVEAGDPSAGLAFLGALPYAAADALTAKVIADPIAKGLSREAGRGANALKLGGATAGAEGVAELSQEELNIQLQAHLDPNFDPNGEEANSRRLNSAVVGALLGGPAGAVTGAAVKSDQAQEAEYIDRAIADEAKVNVERGVVKSLDELQQDLQIKAETRRVKEAEQARTDKLQQAGETRLKYRDQVTKLLEKSNKSREKEQGFRQIEQERKVKSIRDEDARTEKQLEREEHLGDIKYGFDNRKDKARQNIDGLHNQVAQNQQAQTDALASQPVIENTAMADALSSAFANQESKPNQENIQPVQETTQAEITPSQVVDTPIKPDPGITGDITPENSGVESDFPAESKPNQETKALSNEVITASIDGSLENFVEQSRADFEFLLSPKEKQSGEVSNAVLAGRIAESHDLANPKTLMAYSALKNKTNADVRTAEIRESMTPEQINDELTTINGAIKERKQSYLDANPDLPSEIIPQDIEFLSDQEKQRFHDLKLASPSSGQQINDAKARIKKRIEDRKVVKIEDSVTDDNEATPFIEDDFDELEVADFDETQFQRFEDKDGTISDTIAPERAQELIDDFQKEYKGSAKLNIALIRGEEDANAVGATINGARESKGFFLPKSNVIGVIDSNISSEEDLATTLRHELLGHYGLNLFEPEVKRKILTAITNSRDVKSLKSLWDRVDANYKDASTDLKAEELFSLLAQDKQAQLTTWYKQLSNFILKALRKLGLFKGKVTKQELEATVQKIAEGIRSGNAQQQTFPQSNDAQFRTESLIKPETKKELNRRKNKLLDGVSRYVQRNYTREGLTTVKEQLPDDGALVHDLKILADGQKNLGQSTLSFDLAKVRKDLANVFKVKEYNDIPLDEVEKINEALNNPDVTIEGPLGKIVKRMRDDIDLWSTNVQLAHADLMKIKEESLTDGQRKQLDDANNGIAPLPDNHPLKGLIDLHWLIEDNKGSYVNRSYEAFDDNNHKEKVLQNEGLMNRARTYFTNLNRENLASKAIGHNAKNRDAKVEAAINYLTDDSAVSDLLSERQIEKLDLLRDRLATPSEIEGQIRALLESAREKQEMGSLIASGQIFGSKDVSFFKKRKNLPPVIRELLGEYKDPLVNYSRSVTKMQWFVANQKFLMTLREKGLESGFMFKKPDGEFDAEIASQTTDTLSPLGGLFVTPDFKLGMKDMIDKFEGSDALRKFVAINGMVKYGKVVLAPTTQSRNFISAGMFLVHMGHNPFSPSGLKLAGKAAWSDLLSKDSKYKVYINHLVELNVLHDNAYAGELQATLKDFVANNEPVLADTRGAIGKVKKLNDIFQKTYRLGDDFWKIMAFEQEKELWLAEGLSEQEAEVKAAYRVRNSIPTYSMIPRAMQKLRRFPLVGAFVAFPYEILRTSVNSVKFIHDDMANGRTKMANKRIAGMLMAHSFYGAAAYISMSLMGMSDDDDEVVRMLGPEYARNSYNVYVGRDKDGNYQYLDSTFLDPYNLWSRPVRAIMTDTNETWKAKFKDAASELLSPFISPDIIAGTLSEALFNEKQSGGRVYNEQDTWSGQTADVMEHMARGVAPGVWNNFERNFKAWTDIKSPSGREFDRAGEFFAIFGFRNTTLDMVQALRYKGFRLKDRLNDSQRLLSSSAANRNEIDESVLNDAFRDSMAGREHTYRDMLKIIKHMRRMSYNDREIEQSLIASRFSKKDIGKLMRGDIPQWNMSKQFLDSAIKGVSASSIPSRDKMDARRMFNERKSTINELRRDYYAQ